MNISTSLFEGKLVRLGALDHEKDPEIESRWTHDPAFMRMMYTNPMRPLSVYQIKKKYEALEKEIDKDKNLFHFRIRTVENERLIGFGELREISWPNSTCQVRLGIGYINDHRKGYGSEALGLLIHFAFSELNMVRLAAYIPEYNLPARAFYTKAGFSQEVCRREALARDGRRWDALIFGLMASDWKE